MKISLFSVSYAGYWGQDSLDLQGFISKAAELGYDSVMLAGKRPHLSPLDVDDEMLAQTKDTLEKNDISCDVLAGYTDLAPTTAAEVPYLELQVSYVESLARIASSLGAGIVRVFSAYEIDGLSPHAIWKNMVQTLQEMSDRAAHYGVTIAVQNHHDIGVHSDTLLELLNDVDRPNCKAGFDAWSPALNDENLYEAARKMAQHTVISTNADYIRLPRFRYQPQLVNYQAEGPDLVRAVKFGEGFIDYPAFFTGLKEGGFDGVVNFEMCSPIRGGGSMENLDAYSGAFVHWMRANVCN